MLISNKKYQEISGAIKRGLLRQLPAGSNAGGDLDIEIL